jgi:hypothetical protein
VDPSGHMDDYDLGLDIPDDYGDYVDAYNFGFETSYTGWKNNGSPTVTIDGPITTITISGTFWSYFEYVCYGKLREN